jgi:hypothetical protein
LSIEQFIDPELATTHVFLSCGMVVETCAADKLEVLFDDEGVKHFRFTAWLRTVPPDHASERVWDSYYSRSDQMTVRADQIIGFSQEVKL